jgi:hypothetical protein
LAVQDTVAPGVTPEILAEISTAVFWAADVGTGTTAGDTVTVPTVAANASPADATRTAVKIAAATPTRGNRYMSPHKKWPTVCSANIFAQELLSCYSGIALVTDRVWIGLNNGRRA